MKYRIEYTPRFLKDLKLAQKRGKNIDKLFDVVNKIANGEELEPRYRDHSLMGKYLGYRECHIEPDWLLIYEIFEDILVLSLFRMGSHSDLF